MNPEIIHSSLEKHDSSSANFWWRKFVQYRKITWDIDLSIMTDSKEILPQFRDQLELEIKDTFLWAIGQSALTEITKTLRERKPSALPTATQIVHFIPFVLYTRKRCTTLQGRFFQPKKNKRNSRGRMEKDPRRRKELRIRDNNSSRAHCLKFPITNRKVYRGL